MSEATPAAPLVGACHCGRVRVTLPADAVGVVACHCADCQTLHGNFFALLATTKSAVSWEGESEVRWYRSSEENERGFCMHCGSRIAKRPVSGDRIMVSAGLFPASLPRRVVKNLHADSKPAWYDVPPVGPDVGGAVAPAAPRTPEAFVALALEQPIEAHGAQYGYALRASTGNPKPPGVVALTWITAKTPDERDRIRAHSRQNVEDFRKEPGFLSIVTGFTGLRGFTVTAWEDEASMHRALGQHHAVAMRELFSEDFVASVWTGVFTPTRINRLWVRCTACGALEDASHEPAACTRCTAPMPPRPAYW